MRSLTRGRVAVAAPVVVSALIGATLHLSLPMVDPIADASTYEAIATGLLGWGVPPYDFDWATGGLFNRGFAYPLLIAGASALRGTPAVELVGWIQSLVLVPATVALIYLAGRDAFSRRVGRIAAWGFALWFPAQWHTLWLLSETTMSLLLALLVALLAATVARQSERAAIGAGLTLGVLAVSHGAYSLLPFLLIPCLLVHLRHYAPGDLRLGALVAMAAAAVVVPVAAMSVVGNFPHAGEGARGYGGGSGWTFWVGSREATDFQPVPDDYLVGDLSAPGQFAEVARRVMRGELTVEPHLRRTIAAKLARARPDEETLTDFDYYRAGIANLLDHPASWPAKLRLNASTLFVVPGDLSHRFYGAGPTQDTWFRFPWRPLGWVLLVGAIIGAAVVFLRARSRIIVFVPLLAQTAALLWVFVEWRHVIALWPSMFLLLGVAGAHVSELASRSYARHRGTRIAE